MSKLTSKKHRMAFFSACLLAAGLISIQPLRVDQAAAQAVPPVILQPVAGGFVSPVHITHAGDGSGRLFVVQQTGEIFIIQNGTRLAAPFLDIHTRVSCCLERGLLSVAFSPVYPARPYFYVNYTDTLGNTVISRFTAPAGSNTADANSEVKILQVDQPFANHNGGQITFGPDGFLYIGMGDGGDAGDPGGRAQNPLELLGKLLRIDVESPGCTAALPNQPNYCIPLSNPFRQMASHRPEIWALGLRNPWRFSFDSQTGDLYTADVGQGMREEVDFQSAASAGGQNYGWDILEGNLCFEPATGCTPPPAYSAPVFEYDHSGGRCSITGGFVYRGPLFPNLKGIYIYADFCSGEIWGLDPGAAWQNQLLLDAPFFITTFGEGESGLLYTVNYSAGIVYRVAADDPGPLVRFFPAIFR